MNSKSTIIAKVNFALGPILDGVWVYKCSFKQNKLCGVIEEVGWDFNMQNAENRIRLNIMNQRPKAKVRHLSGQHYDELLTNQKFL